MRKSTKNFRRAFYVGLALCPFVILLETDRRNLWLLGGIGVVFCIMIGFAFYAMRLEARGE